MTEYSQMSLSSLAVGIEACNLLEEAGVFILQTVLFVYVSVWYVGITYRYVLLQRNTYLAICMASSEKCSCRIPQAACGQSH